MSEWFSEESASELKSLDAAIYELARPRDGTSRVLKQLAKKYPPLDMDKPDKDRAWELTGLLYLRNGRVYEGLAIFQALYNQQLLCQTRRRIHKGMPLMWMGEAFSALNFPVHAKRYYMLA